MNTSWFPFFPRARWGVALAVLLTALSLQASTTAVVAGRSEVVAVFKQMGVSVEGRFQQFEGEIRFDPAAPETASATLVIDTASFDLGLPDYNAEVRKPEWFDSAAHPQARFSADGLEPLGDQRFRADGTLTLKGKTTPLSAEFTVSESEGHRRFEGEVTLDRTHFEIGDDAWDGVVDDTVRVRFRIAQALD